MASKRKLSRDDLNADFADEIMEMDGGSCGNLVETSLEFYRAWRAMIEEAESVTGCADDLAGTLDGEILVFIERAIAVTMLKTMDDNGYGIVKHEGEVRDGE